MNGDILLETPVPESSVPETPVPDGGGLPAAAGAPFAETSPDCAPVEPVDGAPVPDAGAGAVTDAYTVYAPDGEPLISGEGVPVINNNVLEVDFGSLYDSVYSASYDAMEAYALSVTDGQQVNSTALSYFQGILNNRFLPVDYVIWVGADYRYNNTTYYEYCMAYGDLSLDDTHFTGTCTVVTMRVSGYRSVSCAHGQDISLYAPMYYSRSNLGDYSGVVSYDWVGLLTLIILMIGGLSCFMKKLLCIRY